MVCFGLQVEACGLRVEGLCMRMTAAYMRGSAPLPPLHFRHTHTHTPAPGNPPTLPLTIQDRRGKLGHRGEVPGALVTALETGCDVLADGMRHAGGGREVLLLEPALKLRTARVYVTMCVLTPRLYRGGE